MKEAIEKLPLPAPTVVDSCEITFATEKVRLLVLRHSGFVGWETDTACFEKSLLGGCAGVLQTNS